MRDFNIKFGILGIDHRHVYTQAQFLIELGADLVGWYTKGSPTTLEGFLKRFPKAKRVNDPRILLEDPNIQVILTSAIPSERAKISISAMKHGKDVMSDKPGVLSSEELEELRHTVLQTGRIWSIDFSERFEVPAVTLASQLVLDGAIGDVIHTLGIGPHRLNANSRPNWFFDPKKNGGILADIGSHQIDQFLYFTKSERPKITLASIRNMGHKQFSMFSDFGEIALSSEKANGYIRLDWFTPKALPTWGDGRLFLLGTEGTIEVRKYCDIGGEADDNYVYLTNGAKHEKIYGGDAGCPYFYNFLVDVLERSETAMPQEHVFKVMELAIEAQKIADGEKENELI